jgi:hypothetical protein
MEKIKPEFSYNTEEQQGNNFKYIQEMYFKFVEEHKNTFSDDKNLSEDQKREMINSAWNNHMFAKLQGQIDAIIQYFKDQSEIKKKY